jgi:hypothetical protein
MAALGVAPLTKVLDVTPADQRDGSHLPCGRGACGSGYSDAADDGRRHDRGDHGDRSGRPRAQGDSASDRHRAAPYWRREPTELNA